MEHAVEMFRLRLAPFEAFVRVATSVSGSRSGGASRIKRSRGSLARNQESARSISKLMIEAAGSLKKAV